MRHVSFFIDEIDAVGRHRGAGLGGGNDEREQTLNQMLVEMDGFESNEGVIILAATNRPDVLDPALLRPGRFDRQVIVPLPDVAGREKILKVHIRKLLSADDVEASVVARGTPGFSGADLENLVNEAALLAARRDKRVVTMIEFDDARDKILMGPERRTMIMTEDEKKVTAYHEAGHAVASLNMPDSDPIHKATIIPRGRALGMVQYLPERDQISATKAQLKARLVTAMGGRVAEEMVFGQEKVTTGASADFKAATNIAQKMVKEWGMSSTMGPVAYGDETQEIFLGHTVAQNKIIADKTAEAIDTEVKSILEDAYAKTKKILMKDKNFFIISLMRCLNLRRLPEMTLSLFVKESGRPQQKKKNRPDVLLLRKHLFRLEDLSKNPHFIPIPDHFPGFSETTLEKPRISRIFVTPQVWLFKPSKGFGFARSVLLRKTR